MLRRAPTERFQQHGSGCLLGVIDRLHPIILYATAVLQGRRSNGCRHRGAKFPAAAAFVFWNIRGIAELRLRRFKHGRVFGAVVMLCIASKRQHYIRSLYVVLFGDIIYHNS